MSGNHREPEVPEKVPVVECLDGLARITSKELAITSFAHRQVDEQPTKRSNKNDDKSAVAMLKKGDWHERGRITDQVHDRTEKLGKRSDEKFGQKSSKRRLSDVRQLGCVFQGMTPPKSILRKYRSQEETEWQEQGAREAAWKLAERVFKFKEHERAIFFTPSENRCFLASTLKPEERGFVVDSAASMHMISKKDLSDAEKDTLTKSCSPTIVITTNGDAQTHEETMVYVKELEIFLTLKVLENTPEVFSVGELAMKTGIPTNGSMVKDHISLKTGFG